MIKFEKYRSSLFGCKGLFLYEYDDSERGNGYVAIKFAVPQIGPNRCSLAILNHYDKYNQELRQYLNPESRGGMRGDNIDKMHNTEIRWMKIEDTSKNLVFECRMMPGWHEIEILLKINNMYTPVQGQRIQDKGTHPANEGPSGSSRCGVQ